MRDRLGWTDSGKDILEALPRSHAVLIFVVHGDSQTLWTPEGQKVTAADLAAIRLENHPAVLLLSREGGKWDSGVRYLASTLKGIDASAVVSYSGRIDVIEAVQSARQFMNEIRAGASVRRALEGLSDRARQRSVTPPRLKVRYDAEVPPGSSSLSASERRSNYFTPFSGSHQPFILRT